MSSDFILLSVLLLLLCLFLSAFFSSSETAFISLPRLRLRHLAQTEVGSASRVERMMEKPEKLLTTILLGNNFVNTGAAALATAIAVSALGERTGVLAATAGVTVLLLIFGEIAPKTLATRHGEKLALAYAVPMEILSRLLAPLSAVFVWMADKIARAVGGIPLPRALVSEDEIRTAISAGVEEGTLEQAEAEMLDKVFRFGDREVVEVMTPRPDVVWVEKGTKVSDFLSSYAQHPHSRFPVYENTIDNVVGVLWIKDLLISQAEGRIKGESPVDELVPLRPVLFIPESALIAELFAQMQSSGKQMAVVVDEFGGTAGLVTMEQLLEEIVGVMGDELARRTKAFQALGENVFEVEGGMRIDDANEELGLGLPEGQYETVAGFLLQRLGHIPRPGERVRYENLRLVVTEMKGVKIEKVRVTKIEV